MPHFSEVTETDLRAMAREAASLYRESGGDLSATDAVIKVASTSEEGLTSEHIQRVCEMVYHDVFERAFRENPGPDRLVSFDPPDAVKAASAVRAHRIESFSAKLASAPRGGTSMDKTASHSVSRGPPPAQNAFVAAMSRTVADISGMKKEARYQLLSTRDTLKEAARKLSLDLGSAAGAEKIAFLELLDGVVSSVRQGVAPLHAVEACLEFGKTADASDNVLDTIATDLLRALPRRGVPLDNEKLAHMGGYGLNVRHPLRAQAVKVAELREYRVHGGVALQDIQTQLGRVERELKDALYQ